MTRSTELRDWEAIAHLSALSAFAVAQPVYDIVARHPSFLMARQAGPQEILLLVLLLSVGIPAVLTLVCLGAGLAGRRTRDWTYFAIFAALCALLALQGVKKLGDLNSFGAIPASSLLGLGAAWLAIHGPGFRKFMTWLSATAIIFPVVFLAGSGVRPFLLRGRRTQDADPRQAGSWSDRPSVFFVIFDEISTITIMDERRRVDKTRFPNLAALAEDSIWFRNATSSTDNTVQVLPALLTGRWLPRDKLITWRNYPENLFTFLAGTHRMRVNESHSMICPYWVCGDPEDRPPPWVRMRGMLSDVSLIYMHLVTPGDMSELLPSVSHVWKDFLGRQDIFDRLPTQKDVDDHKHASYKERPEIFRRFLEGIRGDELPTLHFTHSALPHPPWVYLPSGRRYPRPRERVVERVSGFRELWEDDEYVVRTGLQRHILQVEFTDVLIGEFVARLKSTGHYDRSLIILMADHGVSFRPKDSRRDFGLSNAAELLSTPLFIKLPGQRQGRISDRNVESIDILPTIAEALDLPLAWKIDGASALDESRPERPRKLAITKKDKRVELPSPLEGSDKALGRQRGYFEDGGRGDGLFRFGPYRGLLGREEAGPGPGRLAGVTVRIDRLRSLERPDPKGDLPALVTGLIEFDKIPPRRMHLALSLNGTIRAVGRAWGPEGSEARISIMLPESAIRSGGNTLGVFAVSGPSAKPSLTRIELVR
ncbi:sulfatase-like hydrolase/transferase [Elusimicrobiota bacterium]